MQFYKNDRQRYMAGLILIFRIYSICHLIIQEYGLFAELKIPVILNRVFIFVMAVLVYLIGTVHMGKLKGTWMLFLWHFVYVGSLVVLLLIILIKLIFLILSFEIRPIGISGYISSILISPMLYLIMGLLNRLLVKEKHNL